MNSKEEKISAPEGYAYRQNGEAVVDYEAGIIDIPVELVPVPDNNAKQE